MSTSILIIGESGSGKSTSIRTLNPKETYVINVLNKRLPFKDGAKNYRAKVEEMAVSKDGERKIPLSNYCSVKPKATSAISNYMSVYSNIIKCIKYIDSERTDIKTLVIDDAQYVMANEFMARDTSEGWDRFTNIAKNFWQILTMADTCRDDLTIIFLTHSERGDDGLSRCKTIGKMLKEKLTVEGLFTFVLHACVINDQHRFETNGLGNSTAKMPMGMFKERYIPNDLELVLNTIEKFYDQDIPV